MSKFRSFYPFDFQLLNENGEHALFIEDQTEKITLSITNKGNSPLNFRILQRQIPGDGYYHFMLRFRPGTLTAPEKIKLNHENWVLEHSKFQGMDVLSFTLKDNVSEEDLHIESGVELQLPMTDFSANRSTGARETSVELISDHLYNKEDSQIIKATRLVKWPVINHRGNATLPVHVGFVGSNTILNNGEPNDELTLRVSLLHHKDSLRLIHSEDDSEKSKIIISFDEGPEEDEWNIADVNTSHSFKFTSDDQFLKVSKNEEGYPTLFTVSCTEKNILLGRYHETSLDTHHIHDHFDIIIDQIITNHPSGTTNCYVRFENMPGYWDNSFIVPIEKQPMIMRGDKVGIGKEPEAKLDIGGNKALALQAILTRGKDPNFQLVAQNGVSTNNIGDIICNFGIRYELTGFWASGLRFKRGGNDKDVSIGIDTSGEERVSILSDGRVEISKNLIAKGDISVNENLVVGKYAEIGGNLKTNGRVSDKTGDIMPVGAIIAYGGKEAPPGWLVCNGDRKLEKDYPDLYIKLGSPRPNPLAVKLLGVYFYLPDLRSRFIVGAGQGEGLSNYPMGIGANVGEEKHTLLISEMPSHSHNYVKDGGRYATGHSSNRCMANPATSQTDPTGGGLPHNNLPPYYALTYIIKY